MRGVWFHVKLPFPGLAQKHEPVIGLKEEREV